MFLDIFNGDIGHIHVAFAHRHLVRFVAGSSQDGSAESEDAADVLVLQQHGAVFHQAAEAVLDPEYFCALFEGRLRYSADGRIQSRAVTARSQNANGCCFAYRHILPLQCAHYLK